ncbi:hypothetical protein B0A49_05479 [Cryomyces minteri]|uniref:Cell surface protein n=1 Tax=Cryomyces minteri TaxID=331657 RepID=A0A4U0XE16_9PEZI|nr:hypothetical protein B0A49_05479 [Cryomyces minteri]
MAHKPAVIVPLYIYPLTSETWQPLHQAIAAHPDLRFVIILNPNSGPGEPPFPDANYAREIPRLNAHTSVCTIGYVRIDYCKRDISEVCEEVATYAGWSNDRANSGIFVKGIFVDETPNHYSAHVAAYLDTVTLRIKNTPGILGARLVVHNPGTMPDSSLTRRRPDVTAVLEESYTRYESHKPHEQRALQQYGRAGCSYILHSVPAKEVKQIVHELRHRAEFLFVTDLRERYYERFGPTWDDFIEAMQIF